MLLRASRNCWMKISSLFLCCSPWRHKTERGSLAWHGLVQFARYRCGSKPARSSPQRASPTGNHITTRRRAKTAAGVVADILRSAANSTIQHPGGIKTSETEAANRKVFGDIYVCKVDLIQSTSLPHSKIICVEVQANVFVFLTAPSHII